MCFGSYLTLGSTVPTKPEHVRPTALRHLTSPALPISWHAPDCLHCRHQRPTRKLAPTSTQFVASVGGLPGSTSNHIMVLYCTTITRLIYIGVYTGCSTHRPILDDMHFFSPLSKV